jgi:ribonuclease HII
MLILGTDEAGYGPNLGPLAVSITAWTAPSDDLSPIQEPLKKQGLPISDSKKLYHGSLKTLEQTVSAALRYLKNANHQNDPFASVLSQHQVRLLDVQSRIIEPDEFNQLLDQFNSKGSLLSDVTLRLVVEMLNKETQESPAVVLCDKHGGRNHYLDLLTEFFPGEWIQPVQESRAVSVYRWIHRGRPLEFRFLAKGESQTPIALASMFSKYRRESAMHRFNEFWAQYVPGLKPTAGYPEDAKRFKQDIAAAQVALGIGDDMIWRKR